MNTEAKKQNEKFSCPKNLRLAYNVSKPTWQKWLNMIPDINLKKGQKKYTPIQIQKIIFHLGEPG